MICRKCGKENSDNAKYCGNCGTKLVKKSRTKKCILVCFLLGAMICCGIKRYEMPQQENSIKRDEIFQNKKEKTEKSIYKLNETFEIDGLSFTFTKVFASNNEYELWRTTDKSKVIAGFEGTVRNNSNTSVNLSDLNVAIYYIDGKGNKQQTLEPRTEFYAPTSVNDLFSSSSIVGSGQTGMVYMFLTPDKGYRSLEMSMENPMNGRKVIVKNTFYCNGSYKNTDETCFVRAARGYNQDLACVQFYMNEKEYYGYIDKKGRIKFYFLSKYEDDICPFPKDFDNGYIQYKYGSVLYTIDKEGKVASKYDGNYISYGAGYTWVETDESGFDNWGYKYTLYNPDGEVETEIEDDAENITIDYLGNGVFMYDYGHEEVSRKYYFSKTHQWAESYGQDDSVKVRGKWLFDGFYDDPEQGQQYFILYDEEGKRTKVLLPDNIYEDWIYVYDMSEKYILFAADSDNDNPQRSLYVYNMETQEFLSYTGKYANKTKEGKLENKILDESLVVSMGGEDEQSYVGFIDINSMTEIGEPIRADNMKISTDVISIQSSDEQQIYDSKGELLYTFVKNNSTGWIDGFNENTMVAGYVDSSVDEDETESNLIYDEFMDYKGNALFDSIDYASGNEIVL